MAGAFTGACPAERDAVRQQRFQELAVSCLVGARHDVAGGAAHRGTVEIEPYAGDQVFDVPLGEAGVCAGRAGFDAIKAGVDAAADCLGMGWLFGVRPEQGADGDGRHE